MRPIIPAAKSRDVDKLTSEARLLVYSGFGNVFSDLSDVLSKARFILMSNEKLSEEMLLVAQMYYRGNCVSIKLDRDFHYVVLRAVPRCETLYMSTFCTDFKGVRIIDLFAHIKRQLDSSSTQQQVRRHVS